MILLLHPPVLQAQGHAAPTPPAAEQGNRDFDFLVGHWKVHHRKLTAPFTGSSTWREFDATQECRALIGGLGTLAEMRTPAGEPIGVTLHTFEKATGRWSLYWVGAGGALDLPVVGTFAEGVGTFFAKDDYQGKPIQVRWTWSRTATRSPQWEQAFSADGGRTWETNWVMTYRPAP